MDSRKVRHAKNGESAPRRPKTEELPVRRSNEDGLEGGTYGCRASDGTPASPRRRIDIGQDTVVRNVLVRGHIV